MGKKSALVSIIIGGIVLFVIGLPVTFYLLVYSSQQGYPASSIAISVLVSLVLFVLVPFWIMKKGYKNYRASRTLEREKQEHQYQLEKERRALELDRVKYEREKIAKGITDSDKPVVSREREIIREIVKIRCTYCGKLYDERSGRCPHCGASN